MCVCVCVSIAVEFKKLDLASLQSVRQFAQSFRERDLPLNILVNNGESLCSVLVLYERAAGLCTKFIKYLLREVESLCAAV